MFSFKFTGFRREGGTGAVSARALRVFEERRARLRQRADASASTDPGFDHLAGALRAELPPAERAA